MNDNALSSTEHEHLMSQLPWLVNGTLDEQEETQLQTHLAECSVCRDEYASLSDMLNILQKDDGHEESLMPDATTSLASVKGRIARESARHNNSVFHRIRESISRVLDMTGKPVVAFASIGALFLSFVIVQQITSNPGADADYTVLSNGLTVDEIKIAVTFDKDLSDQQSVDVLADVTQQVDLNTKWLRQGQDQFTLVATRDESAPLALPQEVSELIDLLTTRSEVVDAQVIP